MTTEPSDIDIQQLLAVALDEKPSEGFAERVLDQLAVLKTAVELSRLVGVAPLNWVVRDESATRPKKEHDDEE